MRTSYEHHILSILAEVGSDGISVRKLAMHVYNMSSNMFEMPDYNEVYKQVRKYLLTSSKASQPIVERTERRGYYRLNTTNRQLTSQLAIVFPNEEESQEAADAADTDASDDQSLSLFD